MLRKTFILMTIVLTSMNFIGCGSSRSSSNIEPSTFGTAPNNPNNPGGGSDDNSGLFPPLLYSGSETNQRIYDPFVTEQLDGPGGIGVDSLLRVRIQAQRLVDEDFANDIHDNRFQTQDYHKIQYRVFVLYDGVAEEDSFSVTTGLLDATLGESQVLDLSSGLRPTRSNLRIKVIAIADDYMCRYYGGAVQMYCPSWDFWNYNIYNFNMEVEWDLSYKL